MSEVDELRRHIRMLEDVIDCQGELMGRLDSIESHVSGLADQLDELAESVDGITAISKLLAAHAGLKRRKAPIHTGDDAAPSNPDQ